MTTLRKMHALFIGGPLDGMVMRDVNNTEMYYRWVQPLPLTITSMMATEADILTAPVGYKVARYRSQLWMGAVHLNVGEHLTFEFEEWE